MMSPLPSDDRRALLVLARQAIVAASSAASPPEIFPRLAQIKGAPGVFVSLHCHGRLRGCIGRLDAGDALAVTVASCAVSAALDDPRFPPVARDELAALEIEISVLSSFQEIRPHQVQAGLHGLLVSRGRLRGLLLPQVAVQFRWSAETFLEETCMKAGLERDAWKDASTRIEAFTAEVFSEKELIHQGRAQAV